MEDPIITMKLIPSLVNMCKHGIDDNIRIKAATTIGWSCYTVEPLYCGHHWDIWRSD